MQTRGATLHTYYIVEAMEYNGKHPTKVYAVGFDTLGQSPLFWSQSITNASPYTEERAKLIVKAKSQKWVKERKILKVTSPIRLEEL